LKIALNDEESKGQKITLEDEGRTITGKAASKAFVKGYETESNTNMFSASHWTSMVYSPFSHPWVYFFCRFYDACIEYLDNIVDVLSFCNYVLCKLISACFKYSPVCFLVIPSWKLS
jgi:hypothetical protein